MTATAVQGPCTRQLDAIHRITSALFAKTDMDDLLRETLTVSMDTVDAEAGSVLLYEPDEGKLVFRHTVGPKADRVLGLLVDPQGPGKCAAAFRTAQPDLSDSGFDPVYDTVTGYSTRSAITAPIRNRGGSPVGVIQVLNRRNGAFDARDVEMLEIVSALAATVLENARLAELVKRAALTQVLACMAHDIKNQALIIGESYTIFGPGVDASLESLKAKGLPEADAIREDIQMFLEYVDEANKKALDLAVGMQEYESKTEIFSFEPACLGTCIRDELAIIVGLAARDKKTLDLSGVIDVEPFPFDKHFIRRAVTNLTQNAFQAMRQHEKGDTVSVRLERDNDGAFVDIVVEDNGPGIPEAALREILNRQAKTTREHGTGLGTRIVYDVAIAHGGQFLGESEVGTGTTFRVRLPMHR